MTWALVIVAALVLAAAIVVFVRRRRPAVAVSEGPRDAMPHGVLDAYELDALEGGTIPPLEGAPLAEMALTPVPAAAAAPEAVAAEARGAEPRRPREIRWPQRFDPRAGILGDETRLQLLHDLGLLRAAWCVPILRQACDEESSPEHLAAARAALAACTSANGAAAH